MEDIRVKEENFYNMRSRITTLRKSGLIGILAVALIGPGCATVPPYNPFKVSREQIYSKTKAICFTPISVPEGIPDPETVRAKFESLLEAKLREAGFLIVPSKEYAETFKRLTEQAGGYFDPITGKRDESKQKTVREQAYREISTEFNVDAFLYAYIQAVKINWSGRTARWHGASEDIMPGSIFGGGRYGTVQALSLIVSLNDTNGVNMYLNAGGIQLLSKLSRSEFVPVPPPELLVNEERNRNAVNVALEPLTKKDDPSKEPRKKK